MVYYMYSDYEIKMAKEFDRANKGKWFCVGNGGFFVENVDELVTLFMGLKQSTQYFNDEHLFDDYYGIEDIDEIDVRNSLTDFEDFCDIDKMVCDMVRRLYKGIK